MRVGTNRLPRSNLRDRAQNAKEVKTEEVHDIPGHAAYRVRKLLGKNAVV